MADRHGCLRPERVRLRGPAAHLTSRLSRGAWIADRSLAAAASLVEEGYDDTTEGGDRAHDHRQGRCVAGETAKDGAPQGPPGTPPDEHLQVLPLVLLQVTAPQQPLGVVAAELVAPRDRGARHGGTEECVEDRQGREDTQHQGVGFEVEPPEEKHGNEDVSPISRQDLLCFRPHIWPPVSGPHAVRASLTTTRDTAS